jgi:hypothetical protein
LKRAGEGGSTGRDALVSREFLGWYQRFVAVNAERAIHAIHARTDWLAAHLPAAAAVITPSRSRCPSG